MHIHINSEPNYYPYRCRHLVSLRCFCRTCAEEDKQIFVAQEIAKISQQKFAAIAKAAKRLQIARIKYERAINAPSKALVRAQLAYNKVIAN